MRPLPCLLFAVYFGCAHVVWLVKLLLLPCWGTQKEVAALRCNARHTATRQRRMQLLEESWVLTSASAPFVCYQGYCRVAQSRAAADCCHCCWPRPRTLSAEEPGWNPADAAAAAVEAWTPTASAAALRAAH
jgi:hypothetical protein